MTHDSCFAFRISSIWISKISFFLDGLVKYIDTGENCFAFRMFLFTEVKVLLNILLAEYVTFT